MRQFKARFSFKFEAGLRMANPGARIAVQGEVIPMKLSIPLDKARESLEKIGQGREPSAQAVVDAARDPGHPLHDQFEWEDSVAAEKLRRAQARQLIRCVIVTHRHINPEKHAIIRAAAPKKANVYRVLSIRERRHGVLQQAVAELVEWKARNGDIRELRKVSAAIDEAFVEYGGKLEAAGY